MKTQRNIQFIHVINTIKNNKDYINNLSFFELKDKLLNQVMAGITLDRYVAMVLSIFRGNTSPAEDTR